MADNSIIKMFGFELKKTQKTSETKQLPSVVPPTDTDGAGYVTAAGSHYGTYIDMEGIGNAKDNHQLIQKYRGISMHPEVDTAIEEIVNEAIVIPEDDSGIELVLDKVETSDSIKKKMTDEFKTVISLLNFNENGHDMFRSWYIDGRIYHHMLINESNTKQGLKEVRHIDSSKIRKVKEVSYKKDPVTGAELVDKVDEFFIYESKPGQNKSGVKISTDAISYVTSGVMDQTKKRVTSFLHKAIKPVNQLRMMEDSLVIYRLARAPERRIFYIDIGNMQKGKADQYMRDIMARYRNKLVYDAATGELKDDRKHMNMLEDFWLPRKEGGRGTEISTLPGGENLGQIDDIVYFQKRLYKSLNVPISRLEQEAQFSLGRSTEISRDEVKFQKFINRLRQKFSHIFLGMLKTQCILKGIITEEDWESWKTNIVIDYATDNHFSELKEAEVLRERIQSLDMVQQYVGEYYSKEWVMKNVLMLSEDDIRQMQKDISKEGSDVESGEDEGDDDHMDNVSGKKYNDDNYNEE